MGIRNSSAYSGLSIRLHIQLQITDYKYVGFIMYTVCKEKKRGWTIYTFIIWYCIYIYIYLYRRVCVVNKSLSDIRKKM